MSRIKTITDDIANNEQAELFAAIQSSLGIVPNFLRVFANSPDALKAFLGFHHIAGNGSLDAVTRERIALTLAQKNECGYCLSAHTAIGRKAGLNTDEINANRQGDSQDAKAAVAVKFARTLAEHTGEVTNAEVQEMRDAGFTDADIVEVITHTGMNLLTNILSKASRVDIDFPKVELNQAA
ncbi:alkyl hydroperoxide reductase AhpD [Methylophaga marina]|uniref:Carboxymuconolactone decarboxylase family protein n=1 Tax=Methylophaga marina TaxID=45495 RepID=A0ABN0TJ36_9GAMM|nr:peroxidase-related enzyme [Methylophaga marina]BDZ75305.1 alkyl hydroperoxide reductase AhpD [Methylophaga marina]